VQAPPAFVDGELVIEIETRNETSVMPIIGPTLGDGGDDRIVFESPLTLAFGAAYPGPFQVALGDAFAKCQLPIAWEIESLAADPALHATAIDGRTFEVAPEVEGEFPILLGGRATYDADDGCAPEGADGDAPFEITVPVFVRRPANVRVEPPDACRESERHYLESGARLSTDGWSPLRVTLLDADGEPFYPANASPDRPITLTVRADEDTSLGLHDEAQGLAALVARGNPTAVTVESELGPAFDFELIDAGMIDAMELRFYLMGFGGGGIPDLVSGQTYGPAFARTSSSIDVRALGLYAGGNRLCTAPSPLSFELSTSTPDSCAVFEGPGHGDAYGGDQIGVSADVIASGSCELTVEAPAFADGSGLSQELSVTFVGAEGLISPGEGR
jgi:hypothetical protein